MGWAGIAQGIQHPNLATVQPVAAEELVLPATQLERDSADPLDRLRRLCFQLRADGRPALQGLVSPVLVHHPVTMRNTSLPTKV
jgi:hypothetical protein